MDEKPNFLQSLIGEIGELFLELKKKMSDKEVRRDTLMDLGLDPDKEVEPQLSDEAISNIKQYRESVDPDDIAFQSAVHDVKTLFAATKEFIGSFIDDPKDVDNVVWLFFEMMTTNYMRLRYPKYYWLAQFLGFIVESRATVKTAVEEQGLPETATKIVSYVVIELPIAILENIWEFITDPIEYITNLWDKITQPSKGPGHLETFESAENLSQLMTILAGLFFAMEGALPDSRYLFGWSALPRKFEDGNKVELKNSVLGNLLLQTIRKEYKAEFAIDPDKDRAWEQIEAVLKKEEPTANENKIIAEHNLTVERWKRGNWTDLVSERAFSFHLKFPQEEGDALEERLGATLFFVADEEISKHFNTDPQVEVGSLGGLFISLNGEATYSKPINDNWDFKIKTSSGNLLDVYLSRQADANVLGDMKIALEVKRKTDADSGASYSLPKKTGTRLAVGEIKLSAFFSKEDWGVELGLKENAVVISGGEGDSFLKEIMPSDDVPLKFSLSAGVSKKKGFFFDHDIDILKDATKDDGDQEESLVAPLSRGAIAENAPENKAEENKDQKEEKQPYEKLIPLHKNLGLINFDSINWDYGPIGKKNELGAYLKVLATFTTKLGPVMVRVEKTGLGISVSMPNKDGDLGNSNFSYGFVPPKGVALRVESEILSGGGFLELDFDNDRYAGVMDLKLALKDLDIQLVAIGLINTRLPNGQEGFSMLISISAFFDPPFQLPYQFTLNAVGGILGIHRTMKVDILQERIRNGAIRSIMFPENVIDNATKIISDLRAVFPPQKSHYVVAPFFKVGYGTPTILEVDLGILAEIPFKARFILLGSLGVYLPNKEVEKRLAELHIDIFGDFNFAESYVLIEGRLRDSHIVGIPLTGGFAFMLDWSSNPQFLLSAGGYHPRYKKPARFPEIPRLTAQIKKGDDIRLTCQYYQAITSNSFQIGLTAEVVVVKGKAKAIGFLGFNALLQFDPFYFETDIRISVSVSYRGRSFFGIDMEFLLSGPEPWRAQGYAKIKVLFFSLKVKFNISWGGEQKVAPAMIKTDELLEKLQLQLQQTSNWSSKLPEQYSKAESLRSIDEPEQQDLIAMHPSGYLELRQNLVPLNKTIEKLGNSYVDKKTTYEITNYTFGNGEPIEPTSQKSLLGYFSRGQFEDLHDDEKISTPDFDLMAAGIEVAPDQTYDLPTDVRFTPNDFEEIDLENPIDQPSQDTFNWQGIRAMNLAGGRRPVLLNRPEEVFGMLEEVPVLQEKAFKILSKQALAPPTHLRDHYFQSYSSAKEHLITNWPKQEQGQWQISHAVPQNVEVALEV